LRAAGSTTNAEREGSDLPELSGAVLDQSGNRTPFAVAFSIEEAQMGFGVGFVDPESGQNNSASYDGLSYRYPKKTVEEGLKNEAWKYLEVGSGTHTIAKVDRRVGLVLHPGRQFFPNAPVTAPRGIGLMGVRPQIERRFSLEDRAVLDTTGNPSSIFEIGKYPVPSADSNIYGTVIRDITGRNDHVKEAVITLHNVNMGRFNQFNSYADSPWVPQPFLLFKMERGDPPGGEDNSWNHIIGGHGTRAPIVKVTGTGILNRWIISDCVGHGSRNQSDPNETYSAEAPYIDIDGSFVRGITIMRCSVEGMSSKAAAAVHVRGGKVFSAYVFAVTSEGIDAKDRATVRFDNTVESQFYFSPGHTGHMGSLVVNGQVYTNETAKWDQWHNRIVVNQRKTLDSLYPI
jgi:hypothetical protein